MSKCLIKVAHRLGCLTLGFLCLAAAVHAQNLNAVRGRWVWKTVARKNQLQTQFSVVINGKGAELHGIYSVDQFFNGEWQGEDGNQTPFRGRMTGNKMRLEFDPSVTVPGYEENVIYKAPADGRKPSVAILTFRRGTLFWRLAQGAGIGDVPSRLVLRRELRLKKR